MAEYIEALASTVHRLASDQGGDIPYSVIREVSENFIHADFSEPVVSILNSGRTIRFADRGPGIADKDHAVLPGFTTADSSMKPYIRGVGSGLPLVRDYLGFSGGALTIEDNLGRGAVVTVSSGSNSKPPIGVFRSTGHLPQAPESDPGQSADPSLLSAPEAEYVAGPLLTTRQKQVLALVMESGSAGPSLVSKELGIGISTAYRDLASLEEFDLIDAEGGKRTLTDRGLSYLDSLTSSL
ncbi:MAG: ATP-binding protein [Coriobacteriia bacterium]|nr:ATP-binding protein [Coriobacteriia bacterium]